jgi:hypothetical protein
VADNEFAVNNLLAEGERSAFILKVLERGEGAVDPPV